ncbi:hypothetical protein A3I18_01555 [Candidatus Campbellbacteria bacterium RIFCSPLOWO2_02_FULL_35_11]|uniref:Alpha/beta hydrolase n=2 Tax=Candidatus Campbelliibacteriota TaxID=1752727 RepID=A0A1F5EKL7_9BACT|nr:MAG: hypothetical protein A3E89_01470 [Candidatus Campbellbacteria bacterium RIFCSPHIGHO2_12_FULL_35_10]OGD69784.1 MAG: hypothetical protein A3I18_01555 [Candidatus Campbellbacteria bacterium RIFCSPLOWO2_02_FULL_35_11]
MKKLVFVALDAKEYKKHIVKKYPDFDIKYVSLKWKFNLIKDWIAETKKCIGNDSVDLLVGFSVGGIIALLVAKDVKPKKIEIISSSPLFKEVLNKYSKTILNVTGKKRIKEINNLSIKDFKKYCKTTIYVGSEELEIMKQTSDMLGKQIGCPVVVLKNKNHRNILQ